MYEIIFSPFKVIHAETPKCGVSTNQIVTNKTSKKSAQNFVRFVKVFMFKLPIDIFENNILFEIKL